MITTTRFMAVILISGFVALAQQTQDPDAAKPAAGKPAEAKKPEPPKDKPFQEVIKDAKQIEGLFTLYQTEEKVLLELLPGQLDRIYMLSLTSDSGLGERGFYAAAMMGETPVVFHRQRKNIQLVAKNPRFYAKPGTPMSRFVERSFSDSVLGLAKIESLPHPDRNSVLIDLSGFLLADVPMLSYTLEMTFRIPYRFDAKNSYFETIKAYPKNVEVATVAHYATERLPVPPLRAPGAPAPPTPPPPRNLPDPRSMLLHLRYSISELPESGYRPRLGDDRVGHFLDQVEDFTTDVEYTTARRQIARWRLEKQDPSAALSPPKQPIVFWLENTVPLKYRDAIREGILMWNKAFEKIGFKDAIVVRQQPDDADWDAADVRYSTVRWIAAPDAGFAQGPSRRNPYTGEIYDADIRFSESMTRFRRQAVVIEQNPLGSSWEPKRAEVFQAPWSAGANFFCDYAAEAVQEAEFAWDVLETRNIDPDSPEADKFVYSFLREIAAHEVGHTLGLRHNFRASSIHTLEQAQDAALTAREGLTGSVMDYIPANLAARGEKQGEYHQSTLGPYDYWAIEYAYKPLLASTPEEELPELRKIAARAAEPALAYATDEDAGIGPEPYDMDPLAHRFDFGSDPLKFYAHRVKLSEEIWANMEARLEKPGEGYQVLRRSFQRALSQAGGSLRGASKFIGGVYHYRDHAGDPGGRLPFQPVPSAKQKEALGLLQEHLFAPNAFRFSPQLLNKLNNERFTDFVDFNSMRTRFDVPIHDMILGLQKSVLDRVYHPIVLKRILDSEVTAPRTAFRLGDLFTGLQDSVWAETKAPRGSLDINSYRRQLQREHLRKLIGMLLRDASAPEDARTLSRHSLRLLQTQLQGALSQTNLKMPFETRAHLEESAARIEEALKASIQRTAF